MLGRCHACHGFVPDGVLVCPNCDAAIAPSSPSLLKRAALLAASAATAVVLMACYGVAYEPGCTNDQQCGTGFRCDANYGTCLANATEICNNGYDDNDDGLIDCEDPACHCALTEICGNGVDDDHDGLTDCADPDCDAQCTQPEVCDDHIDNDHNGLIDCQDPACHCATEQNCSDHFDDDGDGYVDCQDPDCASVCTSHETDCQNGVDDDLDDLVDCKDPDCMVRAVCGGYEKNCNDGIDDDLDGLIDCHDPDCPACPEMETQCDDGVDNDGDLKVDCEDSDCAATCMTGGCGDGAVATTEQCDDHNTDANDGCSPICTVEKQIYCEHLPELAMGPTTDTTANTTAAFVGTCTPMSGFERGFAFTSAVNGKLYLTLDAKTDMALVVDVGCGDFASELGCENAAPADKLESLSVDVPAGAPLTIFVDSVAGGAGPYTLIANFVPEN